MSIDATIIEEIFEKIKLSIGIYERTNAFLVGSQDIILEKEYNQCVVAEKQRFVVLFTLDMSGSMSGSRWKKSLQKRGRI